MAKERVFNYRNVGTKDEPVWEKWYQKTVADAVLMSDADNESRTLVDALREKIDMVEGKQLSTNDYTTAEKEKLSGLKNITVDTTLSGTSANPVQNKAINTALTERVPTTRKINGKALSGDITIGAADVAAIPTAQKGAANGVAELDSSGKVPAAQLPSYVDDVIDSYVVTGATAFSKGWLSLTSGGTAFTPEESKVYIVISPGKYNLQEYRWSGSTYAHINEGVIIGETADTAHRGDHGKVAYEHSQTLHAPATAEQNVQSDWSVTDTASDAFIKNKPVSMLASGGNSATVGGHTVGIDVPANAVFTDTKPINMKGATTSAAGAAGYVPTPAAGAHGKFLRGDGTWQMPANTTYGKATASTDGLMAKEDKEKLDTMPGIYFASELPTAAPVGSICFLI